MSNSNDVTCATTASEVTTYGGIEICVLLRPTTKEEVGLNAFARVCLSVCLSVSKIRPTQKRVHGFG